MTQHLIPHHSSPFDSIKQVEHGHEYWSACNLQTLMGYTEWRKFADAIDRARLSCQNSGHAPADHFVRAAKMVSLGSGSQREVTDYHLTRYACYLVAMNSDPRKAEVSQAQTYFAVKTREAELAQEFLRPNIHRLSDAMKPRALENLHRVPEGYFSVLSELFRHLYNLEAIMDQALDGEAILEESVGWHWSRCAREELEIPDQERIKYLHLCPNGRTVWAWAYPNIYLTAFTKWLWGEYFPTHFPTYQYHRAQFVARYHTLPAQRRKKSLR
jgi:BRO family protein